MATGKVKWGFTIQVNKGAAKAAAIAPIEEYPVKSTQLNQVTNIIPVRSNPIGAIAPSAVATPFPPRK